MWDNFRNNKIHATPVNKLHGSAKAGEAASLEEQRTESVPAGHTLSEQKARNALVSLSPGPGMNSATFTAFSNHTL